MHPAHTVDDSLPPGALEQLEQYEFLIWDFDGTLVHLDVDWGALKQTISGLAGCPSNLPLHAIIDYARTSGTTTAVETAISEVEIRGLMLLPARVELLRRFLKRSCIVTNNFSATVKRFFTEAKLTSVPFASRDMVAHAKPNPEGAMRLADLWRGKKTLLIGDTAFDSELAAAIGVDYFAVAAP